ncbi:uncharacterized protein TrAFT101_010083 [Trichoderma asperellum]|uniref:uncharacterized protein n=1 Tax=Trichoderma asperellum TaxID=101201 RepID=UPI003326E3B0|nr:hypothetical protein TrAFT101_010083 [Trichoderma asperellum]
MTECPVTESFHEKMKTFVTYTHCKGRHRDRALDAFDMWKKERVIDGSTSKHQSEPSVQSIETSTIQPITAAALQLLPSTPARSIASSDYATSDDGNSFVDSITETRSLSSNTTLMSSLPTTPLRNGTISRFDMEDVTEEECVTESIHGEDVFIEDNSDEESAEGDAEDIIAKEETIRDNIIAPDIKQEHHAERMRDSIFTSGINDTSSEREDNDGREDDEESGDDEERRNAVIKGLGIIGIQRTRSIRDHSPVFQVINSHPTHEKMKEGVVYILEHKKNSSLFKIGWSSKSAKERLRQPKNCYGINTKIIYETKRFVGAPQAERIAQVILRHVNIRVLECFKCQGGHREWFEAPRETVRETVMHVEEFLQMPAYTLQDKVYKLSPEVYDRVVKQMCDFSVARFGELMHGPGEKGEQAETSVDGLVDAKLMPPAQLTDEPAEMSRPNTRDELSEIQEAKQSFVSTSSHDTKSQDLSAGTKLMRKVKWFFSISDSVRAYFSDL